jgi:hypothetical protein
MTNSLARLPALLLIVIVTFPWGGEAQAQNKVRFAYPSSAAVATVFFAQLRP